MTTEPDQPNPREDDPDWDDELPPVLARVMRALRAGAECVDPRVGAALGGGKYRLVCEIGRGGFGVVYEAEQCRLVRRQVAIKIAEGVAGDPRFGDRLKDELRALAALDDPSIVRLLDSGMTPEGFPGGAGRQYLVMDLVRGVPITEYCEREGLGLPARLLLLADAARAVAAAHRRGYIHRDLKPAHILVNEEGQVRLIDFGVAKITEGDRLSRTVTGQSIGTPRYMSPEQRAGQQDKIDNRVDVYALGMVLAELVLGEGALELDPATVARVPMSELLERAREGHRREDVSKKAHRLEAGPTGRREAGLARRWRRACRAHVDWVVQKALADSLEKRYKSADDLRADLVRAAKGETVSARPGSSWLLLRAFVRRRPVLSTAAVVLMLALAFGTPIVTALWLSNARLAREAVQDAEAARFETFIARIGAAQVAVDAGSYKAAREHLDSAPPEYRGWLWEHLSYRCNAQGRTLFSIPAQSSKVRLRFQSLSLDPTGRHVAVARSSGRLLVLDASTGRITGEHQLLESVIYSVRFSPKPGGPIAVGGWSNTLWLVQADDPEAAPRVIPTESPIVRLCFSPDGSVLAAGSADSPEVLLFSMPEAEHLATLQLAEGLAFALMFDSSGERLFVGTDTGRIETWDVAARERLAAANFGASRIHAIERSPHGERFGVCFFDGTLLLLAPEPDGSLRVEARTHGTRGFLECAFSLDGSTLYTTGFETTITAWGVPGLAQLRTWRLHEDHVYSLRVHPTEGTVYSCSLDGTVRILDPAREQPAVESWSMAYRTTSAKWGPLGRLVLTETAEGYTIYDRVTRLQLRQPIELQTTANYIRISSRGELSWTDPETGDGWIVRVDGKSLHLPSTHDPAVTPSETHIEKRQGGVFIRAIVEGVALVQHVPKGLGYFDLATETMQAINTAPVAAIDSLALDPSNQTPLVIRSGLDLFTADHEGAVQHMARIPAGEHNTLELTRNGRWLMVYARHSSEAWVYDLTTRQLAHYMPAKDRVGNNAAISADGRRAMFGRREGDIDVIDTATGRLFASLPASDNVHAVTFDEDGSLWARTYSGTTHVWRIGPGDNQHAAEPRASGGEQLLESPEAVMPGAIDNGD